MKRILSILLLGCWLVIPTFSDTYWIAFTDKKGTIGILDQPATFLSERALARREKQNIAIDSLDLPVSAVYRDSIVALGGRFVHQSRWHNGITIEVDSSAILEQIKACTFVKQIEQTQSQRTPLRKRKYADTHTMQSNPQSDIFTEMLHLDSMHHHGHQGADIHIAVVDNGFKNVNQLAVFAQTQIVGTKDFVEPGNDVFLQGDHGTMVLSTIAAQADNYQGTATDATFYLIRSEDDQSESIREVDAMVAAFEYADSVGADIITSSLGYYYFDDASTDYTYQMHDGKTLRNSIAATIAARKGILVCVSAGNEGDSDWHYISSPADADSILTVGAVVVADMKSAFSSYGPSADGRIKPEVCAMGSFVPVYTPNGALTLANGTSFSCPITAGMAACLWQALPELTNMQLRERILHFASQADTPDNALGYGTPNVWNSYLGVNTALAYTNANMDWTNAAIYDLQGRYIGRSLIGVCSGIYIQKKNEFVRKIRIM